MGVIIDEIIAEPLPPPAPHAKPSPAGKASAATRGIDFDRFNYERRRSEHRAERLWAD
jgi:hypothetical protein